MAGLNKILYLDLVKRAFLKLSNANETVVKLMKQVLGSRHSYLKHAGAKFERRDVKDFGHY